MLQKILKNSGRNNILKEKRFPPIVLLTDFGLKDLFVGVLKGVVSTISPQTNIIDLTHDIEPQSIHQAAYILATSYPYFPKGTVFCVVVDPGVGSSRKAICIETEGYFFVGPDNGVLFEAANADIIKKIVQLTDSNFFLDSLSNTFHGRDVFSPVSAHISKGLDTIERLGHVEKACVEYKFPKPIINGKSIVLSIVYIDRFGNSVLNVSGTEFKQFVGNHNFVLKVNDSWVENVCDNYSQGEDNHPFLIAASASYMEISLKNASAAKQLGIKVMDQVVLEIV